MVIKVTSSPSGVDIYSSNEKWGTTPFDKVDPFYTLEIKDPCFEATGYRFQMKRRKGRGFIVTDSKQSAVNVFTYVGEGTVDASVFGWKGN